MKIISEARQIATIDLRNVSRWYGNVVAVNDVTMTIGPGITGLLGPNGAGKTTLLNLMAGFLAPSRGELTVGGRPSWRNPEVFTALGLVPERDSVYAFLTGADFVRSTAKLHRLPDADAAARRAIGIVDMADAQDRRIATYSKGMRQRIKVAAALVHDPQVLLLDEPFNGMDPRQRLQMMDLLEEMAQRGRTIVFSSHILEEVERMSGTIQVIVGGRLAASGDFRAIRQADDQQAARLPGQHVRGPGARGRADRQAGGYRRRGDAARPAGAHVRLRRLRARARSALPRRRHQPARGAAL